MIYVIIRDVGEYADRIETPIRYVATEAEAIAACERAAHEGKTLEGPVYPVYRGSAFEAERKRLLAEYEVACLAMGTVDPGGPCNYAEYSYKAVRPFFRSSITTPAPPTGARAPRPSSATTPPKPASRSR